MYEPSLTGEPRVLLVSQRRARHGLGQGLQFEFEDVIREIDDADMLSPVRKAYPPSFVRHASSLAERLSPGGSDWLTRDRPPIQRRYDLMVVVVGCLADLQYIWPMGGLFRQARASICVVDELWREGMKERSGELRLLSRFDHVFSGVAGAIEALQDLTARPCSFLSPSVDAVALCPFPDPPARVIDVYSMGRRSPASHGALLELAARKGWFYLYDTLTDCSMPDFRAHRRHLRDLLMRSRFLLAYPGKVDAPEETRGQEEIGYRYFEGAAAGAVLVGQAPANPRFDELFGWEDSVLYLPYGTADSEKLAAALDVAPEREQAIRRANVVGSLRQHDHVYRWAEVLRRVGLPETPRMASRRRQLQSLADSISLGRTNQASDCRSTRRS